MANVTKILKEVYEIVPNSLNGDEVEIRPVLKLVEFDAPVCPACNKEMKNVFTTEGKRRYSCMEWNCTNRRMYDEEGNHLGQNSGNESK